MSVSDLWYSLTGALPVPHLRTYRTFSSGYGGTSKYRGSVHQSWYVFDLNHYLHNEGNTHILPSSMIFHTSVYTEVSK
jgi:hypothetical protein